MSFMLAVPRTGQMLLTEFVIVPDGDRPRAAADGRRVCGRILIFGLEGEMYFGSAVSLEQHLDDDRRARARRRRGSSCCA